jgi:hypothetical protein
MIGDGDAAGTPKVSLEGEPVSIVRRSTEAFVIGEFGAADPSATTGTDGGASTGVVTDVGAGPVGDVGVAGAAEGTVGVTVTVTGVVTGVVTGGVGVGGTNVHPAPAGVLE